MQGGDCPSQFASKITVYMLSKALAISPLEVYKMPQSLVKDMLLIHGNMEQLKADEMDKEIKKSKSNKPNFR